jgi:hypothetical protein
MEQQESVIVPSFVPLPSRMVGHSEIVRSKKTREVPRDAVAPSTNLIPPIRVRSDSSDHVGDTAYSQAFEEMDDADFKETHVHIMHGPSGANDFGW